MAPPCIALEEHYVSQHIRTQDDHYTKFPPPLIEKLSSLGSDRIKDMDAANIRLQILSHGPLDAGPAPCRAANTSLAEACNRYPSRLRGFAMLPMSDPAAAAAELERCVRSLGFLGALINNHLHGRFYDSPHFWPVFAKAAELDVPIYLHPTFAADEWAGHYEGNFSDRAKVAMGMAGWGWHAETGLHVLRLWCSGLFDKYPGLKIVIGHMGEMVPFQLDRIVGMSEAQGWKEGGRGLREVWRENFWVTTSGMFSLAPLRCLLETIPREKVLFSVDYPFSGNERGRAFVEEVERHGVFGEEELRGFCFGNAEMLLGVKMKE